MRLYEITSVKPTFILPHNFDLEEFNKSKFKKFIEKMYTSKNYPEVSFTDAKKFIDEFGIKAIDKRTKKSNWSGKNLYLKGLSGSEIFHEVCHWIIATRNRKSKPEFGLGPGFTTIDYLHAEKYMDNSVDNKFEENATCLLAACWEFHYGRNAIKGLMDTNFVRYDFYNVNEIEINYSSSYDKELNFLISNNLMNKNFEPNYFVRI